MSRRYNEQQLEYLESRRCDWPCAYGSDDEPRRQELVETINKLDGNGTLRTWDAVHSYARNFLNIRPAHRAPAPRGAVRKTRRRGYNKRPYSSEQRAYIKGVVDADRWPSGFPCHADLRQEILDELQRIGDEPEHRKWRAVDGLAKKEFHAEPLEKQWEWDGEPNPPELDAAMEEEKRKLHEWVNQPIRRWQKMPF